MYLNGERVGQLDEYREGERRIFPRVNFKEPVEFELKDGSALIGSLSSDLSEGGIRLRLFKFVPLNSDITLFVKLSWQKTIECQGRVVWVEEIPFSENYQAGVQFKEEDGLVFYRREMRQFLKSYQSKADYKVS